MREKTFYRSTLSIARYVYRNMFIMIDECHFGKLLQHTRGLEVHDTHGRHMPFTL